MQHGTHPHGLSEDEARHRLAAHGPNAIEDRERRGLAATLGEVASFSILLKKLRERPVALASCSRVMCCAFRADRSFAPMGVISSLARAWIDRMWRSFLRVLAHGSVCDSARRKTGDWQQVLHIWSRSCLLISNRCCT